MKSVKKERNYKKVISIAMIFCLVVTIFMSNITVEAAKTEYKPGFYYQTIPASVKKRMNGKSYKANKYVQWTDLRYVRVKYYDFHGRVQSGELVVNKKIALKTVKVFYELYKIKYQMQRMKLIDDYDASDAKSMKANNTSAFNYRKISGSSTLSRHAYGMAIDINPVINPYVKGSRVTPSNGKLYKQRTVSKCTGKYKKYMIHKNDKVYKIFIKYGFKWGGDWKSYKDYQHFEYR